MYWICLYAAVPIDSQIFQSWIGDEWRPFTHIDSLQSHLADEVGFVDTRDLLDNLAAHKLLQFRRPV